MSESWLALGVEGALAANAAAVERWRHGERGAWGHIAGQAVLACRRELGRAVSDASGAWSGPPPGQELLRGRDAASAPSPPQD